MKIEINIDIEAIVREEIRNFIRENIVINDVPINVPNKVLAEDVVVVTVTPKTEEEKTPDSRNSDIRWEFSPKPGRRRSVAEIALHKKELKLGRLLTPEEKGETKAHVEIDEDIEQKAKDDTIKKDRITKMAAEGTKAAAEELAEEEKNTKADSGTVSPDKPSRDVTEQPEEKLAEKEATIPKADDLGNISTLFS